MALLRSGILGLVSGKLGGTEFAQVSGRTVLKTCKVRQSSSSSSRLSSQSLHSQALARWHGLSDSERLAWKVSAQSRPVLDRFSTTRYKTGLNLFLSLPHNFSRLASPLWQDTPPTLPGLPAGDPIISVSAPNSLYIDYAVPPVYPDMYGCVSFSRFQVEGSRRKPRIWKHLPLVLGTDALVEFDSVLGDFDINFLSGEWIYFIACWWYPGRWPTYVDFGLREA
jgi:hypothetical protein